MTRSSRSDGSNARRHWSRCRCGRHQGSGQDHPSARARSGSPRRWSTCRRRRRAGLPATDVRHRRAACCAAAAPGGVRRRTGRECRLRRHRAERCGPAPRWRSAPASSPGYRRIAAAHGSSRRRARRHRVAQARHKRRSRRPAACRRILRGARPAAHACGRVHRHRQRPAERGRPRAARRVHRPTAGPS